ncbi:uncharacterized protein [Triticum aestivum]|uniref:uncharacterized protein n=1 Tax=Triticum aestivum TaxID=4565 RepID=UPI001D007C21|nr:uncharacterized protein LOC123190658 [Triticum aestivum]
MIFGCGCSALGGRSDERWRMPLGRPGASSPRCPRARGSSVGPALRTSAWSSQLLQTSPVIVCGNCRSPEWPPLAIERPCRLPPLSSAVMWRIEAPEGAASTRIQRRASSTMGCLSRLHRALVLRRWSAVEAEGPRVLGAGGRVRDGGAVEFLA